MNDIKRTFTEIYETNWWGDRESVSGPGSSLFETQNLRSQLPKLFEQFDITSLFDAPCGDFNWMKELPDCFDYIKYIGGDIVDDLVTQNQRKYPNFQFVKFDLTTGTFPEVDLWLCRDFFIHLDYHDTFSVLENFANSKIKYILTNTYETEDFENYDLNTGNWRPVNLFAEPYYFPRDVLCEIDDRNPREPLKKMCLWARQNLTNTQFKKFDPFKG